MSIRRVLASCLVATAVAASPALHAQQAPRGGNAGQNQNRNPQQQQDISALVQAVDAMMRADSGTADQTQGDIQLRWDSNHYIKSQDGSTYVPFTVDVSGGSVSPMAVLYVRAVPKGTPAPAAAPAGNNQPAARTTYPWDNAYVFTMRPDNKIQRAMQLPGGEYDVFVAVKDQSAAPAGGDNRRNNNNQQQAAAAAPAKLGVIKHHLTVPDFKKAELAISSVLMGEIMPLDKPLPQNQQAENPYVFGSMRVTPVAEPKLSKSGELSVLFWIYGAAADPATKKPNVSVEYNFYQKMGDMEKYFNKTAPQDLNAQTLPPDFDVAAGHQLPGNLAVPLASFPAGDYRLEITVTDKVSGKSLKENVNFTVNAA